MKPEDSPLYAALLRKFRNMELEGKSVARLPNFGRVAWLPPIGAEAEYQKFITATLEKWYKPYEAEMARVISNHFPLFRADAAADEWELIMAKLLTAQKRLFDSGTKGNFLGALIPFAEDVNKFSTLEFNKFLKIAIDEPLPMDEPWLKPMIDRWAEDNYKLIKTMSDNYIAKTNDIVKNSVANGLSYREVMAKLQAAGTTTTKTHAKLVARDQIGKLNGAMTQARQENVGVEAYTWDTSGDERVRGNPSGRFPKAIPSHYIMDGKTCRWDDRSVWMDTNGKWVKRDAAAPIAHPGEEIQCRCSAIPLMDELWEAAANRAGLEAKNTGSDQYTQGLNRLEALPLESVVQLNIKGWKGENVLDDMPMSISDDLFRIHGVDKNQNLSQIYATSSGYNKSTLRKRFQDKVPPDQIRVVKWKGNSYVVPGSTTDMSQLSLMGVKRAKMQVVDMDALASKLPKKKPAVAPVKPRTKPTPKATPVKPTDVKPIKVPATY